MPTATTSTASADLVEALSARRYDDIPAAAVHEAKRLILDHVGVGLAGCQADSGRIVADYALRLQGPAESSLLGRRGKVAAPHAAFANAVSSHSVELDDVDEEALFHHGPPIVAAARAVAEAHRSSGKELIRAVVAGSETMTRLSKATNPALRNRAFHTTPTCGVFGAAMAAGLLSGLSVPELVSALGLAGAQSCGLMEMYGTSMQKRFNPGPAARDGVTAAQLAASGFTGADSIIDGERGFAAAFAGAFDQDAFRAGLGSTVPFTVEYKPYSCARPIHNAIDAMLELRADHRLRPEQVASIVFYRHPTWAHYHVISEPRTFHEAQVSLPYSAALALVEGSALPEQYQRVGHDDAVTMALSKLTVVKADPSLARGVSCRLVVTTTDGRELTATVDYPRGSIQVPLDDEALAAKFSSLATATIEPAAVKPAVDAIYDLENLADVNELAALLTPKAATA